LSDPRLYLLLSLTVLFFALLPRWAGRVQPRATIAPLLFLLSRWPVLLSWAIGTAGMIFLLVPKAIANGRGSLGDLAALAGLCLITGLGVPAALLAPPFVLLRALSPAPRFYLEPGELLLHRQPANHFLQGESRGGMLVVTSRRVIFQPHRFNLQLDLWITPVEELGELHSERDRFVTAGDQTLLAAHAEVLAQYLEVLRDVPESARGEVSYSLVARSAPQPALLRKIG
jgi:hypothetical protein